MVSVVRLTRTGGPEVLTLEDVGQEGPGPNEAWVEQQSIGVNYLDVMQRKGLAPIPVPGGLGLEAAGRVTAVGASVTNVSVGDRVAYILGGPGSYASGRSYPAERLVPIPEALSFDDAAAILFKGITAQYLLKTTYPVGPGTVILLYGVAGGVGQLLAPWAKHLGATVIGVVSKEASVERARSYGCDGVLVWGACDLPAEVASLTEGGKAHVVYDGVGRETFQASLNQPAHARPDGFLRRLDGCTAPGRGLDLGEELAVPDPTLARLPRDRRRGVSKAGGRRVLGRGRRHHQARGLEDVSPRGRRGRAHRLGGRQVRGDHPAEALSVRGLPA